MTDTVLVSGGSGYIAGFLIRQLVAEGWRVRTTVRSLARESAVRQLLAVDESKLKFFAADLNADAGWAEAMAGCSHVAHLASPLPGGVPKDANELIVPARDGALRALRAAKATGVKRFVMTSSVAAIAYGRGRGTHHFTEADSTQLDQPGITAYIQSKTIAERTARACPDIGFGIVDVRDVADLHVRALKAPNMVGERFIASGRFMKLRAIADVLRAVVGELGSVRHQDASHAKAVLGWATRPAEQGIFDTAVV